MLRLEIIFILIFFLHFICCSFFFSNNKYGLLLLFRDNKKSYFCFGIIAGVSLISLAALALAQLQSFFHIPVRSDFVEI